MNLSTEDFTEKLKKHHIKPSHQRLKILEFIATNPCHPTVDRIYSALHHELPTLSKATIYNTLNTFVINGLVQEITIEDNEVRYDFNTKCHGHFKCRVCLKIYDFFIGIDDAPVEDLKDFLIETKNVYFKGICKECVKNAGK